jgi:hypothetical protein
LFCRCVAASITLAARNQSRGRTAVAHNNDGEGGTIDVATEMHWITRISKFRAASAALTAVEPTTTMLNARMAAPIDMVLNDLARAPAKLAGTPEAIHPRRDYRAARTMLLDVSRGAVAHGVRTRIVAWIHAVGGLTLVARIDRDATHPPSARCGPINGCGRDGLCDLHAGRRGLRQGSRCQQRQTACKGDP